MIRIISFNTLENELEINSVLNNWLNEIDLVNLNKHSNIQLLDLIMKYSITYE